MQEHIIIPWESAISSLERRLAERRNGLCRYIGWQAG